MKNEIIIIFKTPKNPNLILISVDMLMRGTRTPPNRRALSERVVFRQHHEAKV